MADGGARPAAAQVQPRDAPLFDRGERRPSPASCGSPRRGNQDCGFCPRACRLARHALHNFRSRHELRLASDCVVKVRRLQTRTLGVREACDLAPHPRPPAQATPLGPWSRTLDVPSGDAARPKPVSERRVPATAQDRSQLRAKCRIDKAVLQKKGLIFLVFEASKAGLAWCEPGPCADEGGGPALRRSQWPWDETPREVPALRAFLCQQ